MGMRACGWIVTGCTLGLLCAFLGPATHAEDDPFSEPEFDNARARVAVAKAIRWLEKKQGRDGSYGGITGHGPYGAGLFAIREAHPAGPTAWVLYALLRAGRAADDPAVARGFRFLRKHHRIPETSYEISALLLAVTATAPRTARVEERWKLRAPFRNWAHELADTLIERRTARGWRYNRPGSPEAESGGGPEDLSSTTFALLALSAAARCGIRVQPSVWRDGYGFACDQQEDEGPPHRLRTKPAGITPISASRRGCAYVRGLASPAAGQPTGGMTAAALASIELARFGASEGGRKPEAIPPEHASRIQAAIYDGLAWLDADWDPARNPKREVEGGDHIAWRFQVATAMDVLGLEALGTHAWFEEMGQRFLDEQAPNGHWDSKPTWGPADTLDTAFAILFLTRHARGLIPYPRVRGGRDRPHEPLQKGEK